MITYLMITFNSEGEKPSEVVSALENIGFKPATGFYDLQYDWKGKADLDDLISLADKVASTLKGMKVSFKLETARE